ncbi:MAG: DUF3108 domain-containing protein [Candidatus Omnitrophota bacterium]|nr:DUF3108 domain-containing protein [Candidatus Omnitrophota bacterium]
MSRIVVILIILSILIIPIGYADEADVLPFSKGETLTYEVKLKKLNVGKSVLTFHGIETLGYKELYHITFSTRITALTDVEELYAEKETFLPVEVHRTIKKFGTFTTRVIEKYDQEAFRVDIKQKTKFRKKEFSIEKDRPIHNAILLSYFCRTRESFSKKETFDITIPAIDFKVMFAGEEIIETPLGKFNAYLFTSDPPKFKLWLSTDEKRIPLMIENPSKIGYSLVIKEISP